MDLKSSHHNSPVITDPVPISKSRLGIQYSSSPLKDSLSLSPVKYSRSSSRKSCASIDDVRSNGWLDAMKASSPPRKKYTKGFNDTNEDHDYCSWLVCASQSLLYSL